MYVYVSTVFNKSDFSFLLGLLDIQVEGLSTILTESHFYDRIVVDVLLKETVSQEATIGGDNLTCHIGRRVQAEERYHCRHLLGCATSKQTLANSQTDKSNETKFKTY